jgi:hypothetical protein
VVDGVGHLDSSHGGGEVGRWTAESAAARGGAEVGKCCVRADGAVKDLSLIFGA